MDEIIREGRTREEALNAALDELGVTEEDVEVETLDSPREGLLGLVRSRPVKIRVSLRKSKASTPETKTQPGTLPFSLEDTPEDMVRKFLEKVLELLGVRCETEVHEGENNIFVDIGGEDSGIIIGKYGQTLDAIQFLTNVIMSKKYGNKKKILINVGDYRKRREDSIHKLARAVARKVLKTKKSEALAPMPPQDRRIVHLALSSFDHITTTSEGTGKNRKVIIDYKE